MLGSAIGKELQSVIIPTSECVDGYLASDSAFGNVLNNMIVNAREAASTGTRSHDPLCPLTNAVK